jgi:hypothetical protein
MIGSLVVPFTKSNNQSTDADVNIAVAGVVVSGVLLLVVVAVVISKIQRRWKKRK